MTCVSVGAGPPVAVGLAFRSYCFMNAVTMPSVDEPLVEKAIVLPSVSLSDLIGELDGDVPVEVGRAGRLGADDAHRRTFGKRAEHAHDTGRDADVDAAGDHRLLRFAAALRPEDLERQPVLLEDAARAGRLRRCSCPSCRAVRRRS